MPDCARCLDERWVCEDHHDRGWPNHDDCGCGMPCPDCNPEIPGVMPLDETGQRIVPNLLYAQRAGEPPWVN
jgi:hypothetical protein